MSIEYPNHKAHLYADRPILCTTMLQRFRGIYFRSVGKWQWLLLTHCSCIHTFFLRRPIDVIFLDSKGRPLRYDYGVRPWHIAHCRGASLVIELWSGLPLRQDQIERLAGQAVKSLRERGARNQAVKGKETD